MSAYKIFKVNALPAILEANAIYLVAPAANPDHVEIYVTDKDGTAAKRSPTLADIQGMIDTSIIELAGIEIVADITERDALTLSANTKVLVLDASDDATVEAGAATYIYNAADDSWTKISEEESMDLILKWGNITEVPEPLTKVDEDADGNFTYDGVNYVQSGAPEW